MLEEVATIAFLKPRNEKAIAVIAILW